MIFGGEIAALVVGGILFQATGVTAADLAAGHISVPTAIARALTQSATYLGPIAYLYLGWRRGGTVGTRAVHCRLRSADALTPPSSTQVILRLCGLWFSIVCVGIGLIWGAARRDRRGWSDLFAGTVVVHEPPWTSWQVAPWNQYQGGWNASPQNAWPAQPSLAAFPSWPPTPPPLLPLGAPPPPPVAPPPPSWPPGQPPAFPPAAAPAYAWSPAPVVAATPGPDSIAKVPWTWTDVVPVVVLLLPMSFAVEYVTVAVLKWLMSGVPLETRRPIEALASDITAYGSLFLFVLLFVRVRRHASLAALGLRRPQWRWMLAALPFTFLAILLESISGLLSQSLFPQAPANQCVAIRDSYSGAIWLAIIGVAVIAPFVEEVVFRGMVFGWLRGRTPLGWAIVISAALFSLEHIGFLQLTLFLPIFTSGLVLGVLYHHARSIWPTVMVHGTFNLIATLVLFNSVSC